MKRRIILAVTATGLFASSLAWGQAPPKGLLSGDKATEGKTDVAAGGFEKATIPDEESTDATELKLSLGGLFTSGNSKSMSLTSAGAFRLRRDANQLVLKAAGNYAQAAPTKDDGMDTTLENLQGRARYDRFFSSVLAGFVGVSALHDRFLGLDMRLNIDPGLAFYIIDDKGHQLWTELGYDFQYDLRRDETIEAAKQEGTEIDKSNVRHSGRLFFGYENSLNKSVTLNTGFEYLQGLQETKNYRLNWDAGLTSNIGGDFAIATTLSVRYDHNPLPDVEKLDVVTAISVVYSLL